MNRWVIMALDERTAGALGMLLARYNSSIATDRDPEVVKEMVWATTLCLRLNPKSSTEQTREAERLMGEMMRTWISPTEYEECTASHRLNWPGDSEWIAAQSRAGRLISSDRPGETSGTSSDC